MSVLNNFRKNIIYFFLSLPFVIVMYELLMTLMLANRGYTILLLGQLGLLPLVLLILDIILANNLVLQSVGVLFIASLLGGFIYFLWFFFNK